MQARGPESISSEPGASRAYSYISSLENLKNHNKDSFCFGVDACTPQVCLGDLRSERYGQLLMAALSRSNGKALLDLVIQLTCK